MTAHILVVDDEPDLQLFMELAFKKKIRSGEYHFHFAHNGKQALELLGQHCEIHVVLTDLNKPEMDGYTLLERIKASNNLIKAVVLSAYGDLISIRNAMNRGAFDFLTKPMVLSDLQLTLAKALDEVRFLKQAEHDRKSIISIERELDIAHQLQQSMMPTLPIRYGDYLLEGQMLLTSKVGGDFWDLIELNQDEALLVMGDSSGHGLGSALVMSAIRHCLRALATQISDYRDFVTPLNQIIYREFSPKSHFATMVLMHLSKKNSVIRYLRAGHELVVHRRGGIFQAEEWRGGLPIGLFARRDSDEWVEVQMAKEDELILYTDGVTDGVPSRENRIAEILTSCPDLTDRLSLGQFYDFLAQEWQWCNVDDATLLRLSVQPAHE